MLWKVNDAGSLILLLSVAKSTILAHNATRIVSQNGRQTSQITKIHNNETEI